MKRSVLLGGFFLLLLTGGCAVEEGYGGAYGVYGEYPSTYYGPPVYYQNVYPAPVYRYHYWHHPYDRDHYWDRHEHWEHRDWD